MLTQWLNRIVRERLTKSSPTRRSRHLRLGPVEALEDRCLLATFTVANTNDAGPGSLRQAVDDADNTAGLDTIVFNGSLTGRTITLATEIQIDEQVTINGPTSSATGIVISGNNATRIFLNTASNVTLNNLTLTNASVSVDGGALNNDGGTMTLNNVIVRQSTAGNGGGGIRNAGTLTLNNSRVESNRAVFGGGLSLITGSVTTINRSTISGNLADGSAGGGLVNNGTATINASTISGNTATALRGGGIAQENGTLTINNTTIAHNVFSGTTGTGGGGFSSAAGTSTLTHVTIANNISLSNGANSSGGVTQAIGTVTVDRSIIAQNLNPENAANNNTGGTVTTTNTTISDDVILGPLQDNGGPTLTLLPLAGISIDALASSPLPTDQRGYTRNVDGNNNQTDLPDRGAVELHPAIRNPYAVSTGPGVEGTVFVFEEDGTLIRSLVPYPGFMGGVRVALGDVSGDGTKDIITAPGAGGGPNVKVFNGVNGTEIVSFNAYPAGFTGGLFLATGDFDADGQDDIVTAPGPGGGPDIRVIDSDDFTSDLLRFSAYNPAFRGGVQVAVATINGNNPDIVTAPGPGGGPNVRVFSGTNNGVMFGNFNAYSPNFTGGVFVGTGDVNGDGQQDIITGPGFTGGPHVRVFDGASVFTPQNNPNPTVLANSFPYMNAFTGGVRVSSADINGDGFADIITGAGTGGGPHVTVIDGRTLTQDLPGERFLRDQFPLSINFTGGVFVAGSSPIFQGGSPLLLHGGEQPPSPNALPQPTVADVELLKSAAIAQFAQAGLDEGRLAQLETVSITLTELDGNLLGLAFGNTILIDADAAGFGYFVDATPGDDIEFQTASSGVQDRVDLLTVIAHELGHMLGLEHGEHGESHSGLLADHLPLGVRRRVTPEDLEALDTLYTGESLLEL